MRGQSTQEPSTFLADQSQKVCESTRVDIATGTQLTREVSLQIWSLLMNVSSKPRQNAFNLCVAVQPHPKWFRLRSPNWAGPFSFYVSLIYFPLSRASCVSAVKLDRRVIKVTTDDKNANSNTYMFCKQCWNNTIMRIWWEKLKKKKKKRVKHEKKNQKPLSGVHFWYLLPHLFEPFL